MATVDLLTDIFLACGRRLRVVSCIVPPQDIEDIVEPTWCASTRVGVRSRARALMLSVARNLALNRIKRAGAG